MTATGRELCTLTENESVLRSYKVSDLLVILLVTCSGNKVRLVYILLAANLSVVGYTTVGISYSVS